jgi:hypothetical protein
LRPNGDAGDERRIIIAAPYEIERSRNALAKLSGNTRKRARTCILHQLQQF